MTASRRLSSSSAKVLELFLAAPERQYYGLEIIKLTGIKSGSLYPILHRLESRKVLTGSWEELDRAAERGSRPRRCYGLNPEQSDLARELHAEWVAGAPRRAGRARLGFAT